MNPEVIQKILQLLPFFLIAFTLSLLLTPWMGRLSDRIGAIDLPPAQRQGTDRTRARRVHHHFPGLMGGLGMVISLLVTLILLGELGNYKWGVIAGLIVVTVTFFLDDLYDLPPMTLFGAQILAGFLVVLSGITVSSIQVAGVFINFNLFSQALHFGEFTYNFIFPADLLTILWIAGLMNVINWVGGVDGLNGSVSAIIGTAMMLIAMKLGIYPPAIFLAAYVGSVLGVLPFNYHLSKIFYGAIGDFGNGYILAVMSILAGTKLPLFLILMGLPFFDALVVFVGRIARNHKLILRPWKVLSVNDKTHFHHRLLDLGFSHKGVMFIECGITIVLCAIALYISDFRLDFVFLLAAGSIVLIIISLIAMMQRRYKAVRKTEQDRVEAESPKVKIEVVDRNKRDKDAYRY